MEGVDGSGKTTQAERLCAWLRQQGRQPLHIREPGTTELGEQVREILLAPHQQEWTPSAEAMLFFAARRELLLKEVLPALRGGQDVICERFTPSTLAYQGQDSRDRDFILNVDAVVVADSQPDAVLILDLPAEESLARAQHRAELAGEQLDGMEARGLAYLQQVRDGYIAYATARPERSHLLDTNGLDPDQVERAVRTWATQVIGLQPE